MAKNLVKSKFIPMFLLIVLLTTTSQAQAQPSKTKAFTVTKRLLKRGKRKYVQVYDHRLGRRRVVKNEELIIKFKPGTSQEAIRNYLAEKNLEIKNSISDNLLVCTSNNQSKFVRMLSQINDDKTDDNAIVDLIDINEYKTVHSAALKAKRRKRKKSKKAKNHTNKQWHLKNNGINGLVADSDVDIEGAWAHTMGEGVKIAVIDTGFDLNHPDLPFAQGYNALAFNSNSDALSVQDLNDASAPQNSNENHGTAVAGIIGALRNKSGVTGIAPNAEIIPIRMINDNGEVSTEQIIMAQRKAIEMGATIVNNSWGSFDSTLGPGETLEISEMEKENYRHLALDSYNGKGALLFFASGNSGKPNFNNSPEARLEYTVAVGASDSTGQRARYSVFGKELDLVAPGGGFKPIYTTDRTDIKVRRKNRRRKITKGYNKGSVARIRGTSAASPVAAGIAALVWSVNPDLSAKEVREILSNTADKNLQGGKYKFTNGKSRQMGAGVVNAARAVEEALRLKNKSTTGSIN